MPRSWKAGSDTQRTAAGKGTNDGAATHRNEAPDCNTPASSLNRRVWEMPVEVDWGFFEFKWKRSRLVASHRNSGDDLMIGKMLREMVCQKEPSGNE